MRDYELSVIFDLGLAESGGPEASVEAVKRVVEGRGGLVKTVDHWGRRRMAYPINKALDGDYVISRIEIDPAEISAIEAAFRIDERVYRSLVIRADELYEITPMPERAERRSESRYAQEASPAPSTREPAPAAAAPAPAAAPTAESQAPAAEAGAPEAAPSEAEAPQAETTAPAAEAETPAAQAETPAAQAEAPAAQAEAPAAEAEAPAAEAEPPAEKPAAATEETPPAEADGDGGDEEEKAEE